MIIVYKYFNTWLVIISLEIIADTKLTQSETPIWLGQNITSKNI